MKRIALAIIIALASGVRVWATLDPGTVVGAAPSSTPPFLLLAPVGGGSYSTPLPFSVVSGDVVLLESGTAGIGSGNWSEVLSFTDVGGHGMATVYALNNFSGFALDPGKTGQVIYMLENSGSPVTTYSPGTGFPAPQGNGTGPGGTQYICPTLPTPQGGGDPAIPEASTWIAGVLLLLPSGLSVLRVIRNTRTS